MTPTLLAVLLSPLLLLVLVVGVVHVIAVLRAERGDIPRILGVLQKSVAVLARRLPLVDGSTPTTAARDDAGSGRSLSQRGEGGQS
jgi:hypothetical protein